jgi:putative transposase
MARVPRHLVAEVGLPLHKIWRSHNREWNLGSPEEKLVYLSMLNDEIVKQETPLRALCLMSSHSHEIYALRDVPTFSHFMRCHHGRYGQFFNKKHGRCGKVAQDRPKTYAIGDDGHEMAVTFYVHANPVRAGIVRDAKDYLWSTHRLYAYGKRFTWTKNIRFPSWYMDLARTWPERQKKYRRLFDAYLRERGLIKQAFSLYGIGDFRWRSDRRAAILKKLKALTVQTSPP